MINRLLLTYEQNLEALHRLPIKIKKNKDGKVTAHCPFHKDSTPSLNLNLKKGIWKCFSCKRSGTLASLVYELTHKGIRNLLQLDDKEIKDVVHLNSIASINYEPIKPEDLLKKYEDMESPTIKGKISLFKDASPALQFINERDIKKEVAEAWDFRYVYSGYFYSHFKDEDGEEPEALFIKNRLVLPVRAGRKIISYELRALQSNTFPKTLYLSPIDYLFRYQSLDKTKPVYVVEGLVDAARLYPLLPNITYLFGSALTDLKIHLLKTFPEVILIPDNDAPGFKVLEDMIKAGLNVKVLSLPLDYEDAGDRTLTYSCMEKWLKTSKPITMSLTEVKEKILYFKF